ncbi:MAG: hypothetical protein A2898_01850 [Candidatus Kerfeldbacteria bacterium RIFCSPLOWO2_01_FULL_48_11]|uniref:Uncharacterized protein n=1 Tax=Candidatus Kerfeldbacteria bacterium RIFCSPLOWO2_01_FULL_48_11 TaxID=1798543 RepID=A0A1G2B5K9_9BACT|nr:MAG: hypothetical protein UY34_C0008G0009 [Parcubacteria group bacterium GW2011_GWA2_48_9]OGY83996.1 MAG: hypothetical protein A2898_01850 [Candidatus Kerfeldbacteria bacterium RIFCSPLOWO2_01_FULL_48_11]
MSRSKRIVTAVVFAVVVVVLALFLPIQPESTRWTSYDGKVSVDIDSLYRTNSVTFTSPREGERTYRMPLPVDQDGNGSLGFDDTALIELLRRYWNQRETAKGDDGFEIVDWAVDLQGPEGSGRIVGVYFYGWSRYTSIVTGN